MQFTYLSLATIILVILRANNVLVFDWWLAFVPIFLDATSSLIKELRRKALNDAISKAFIEAMMKEDSKEDDN